jgi:hypothetical protein
VLTGAGDTEQIGLRRHLRTRWRPLRRARPTIRRTADTIILGIAASSGGTPHWWQSDGAFIPLRYSPLLRRAAGQIAEDEAHLQAQPHRSRGNSPTLPGRLAGLPALTIGCLDRSGLPPRSHHKTDVADSVEPQSLAGAVQFALLLIDRIDAAVAGEQGRRTATPA